MYPEINHQDINHLVAKIKQEKPLILNITNYVTMDFIANGLACLGASPLMTHAVEELEDLIKISNMIVINLGTLDPHLIHLSEEACRIANQLNTHIILDPVGTGASKYRTLSAQNLLQKYKIATIRGNASEIMALAGLSATTKGVDSQHHSELALESAQILAKQNQATVIVSGKTDFVVHPTKTKHFAYGSEIMPLITGTGCVLSAVIGAFQAVCNDDHFKASVAAAMYYALCGESAHKTLEATNKNVSPAAFKIAFLDALFSGKIAETTV